jgi:hypothetical protein
MSGEIKAPTVFIENKVVSQRHLNAVVFANYLRTKIAGERALGDITQKIRLEAFLPMDVRKQIPPVWSTTKVFLDFLQWLEQSDYANVVERGSSSSFWGDVSDVQQGIEQTAKT